MIKASSSHGSGVQSSESTPPWESILATVSESFARGAPDSELRAGLRLWCAEARRRDLLPETFLPLLKNQIVSAPGMRRRTRDLLTRDRALQRLVTMCIEEYYASDRGQQPES